MSRDPPHELSNSLTPGFESVSPRISQESRAPTAGVRIPSIADMQPKGPNVVRNEWQLWGSRSGSPQAEKPDFSNLALELVRHKGPDVVLPHEGEWIADASELNIQPGQQPQNANTFPRLNGAPFMVLSGEPHMPPYSSSSLADHPHPYMSNRIYSSSPPHGMSFPVAYFPNPMALQRNGPFETQSIIPQTNDDARRLFRGMPVAEADRSLYHGPLPPIFRPGPLPPPPFPPNAPSYNTYHPPDYGNYYLAQPLEPFTDYSFRFDGFRAPQGRPPYPIPHPNLILNNNTYSPPHSTPGPPNIAEVSRPMMSSILVDYQAQPPPPLFYPPRPVQIIPPPPIPAAHSNITASALLPPGIKRGNPISPVNEQFIPTSLSPPRRSAFHSFPKGKQGGQPAISSSQTLIHTLQRQHRRPNLLPLVERSALLEDFRSNRENSWDLKDILGHIVEFSGDQYGSRFIQQNLEAANDEEKQKIFDEIVPSNVDQLVRDVFGNYVIQKFFEFGTQAQKDTLADIVQRQVISLSLHIYGCRVVQRAIDYTSEPQQTAIIQHMEQDILTCIKDAHGNHVIQKLVEVVPPNRLTFLPLICENILALSTHPYGCRVLQRCLEHLPDTHTRALLQAIHVCTLELMQDQYGNYVIQFIIEQGREYDKVAVISQIQGNLIKLSQHKYASNVCEKALNCTDSETRHSLINEIMIAPSPDSEDPILTMVKDQYANYVLQRALIVVEGQQREDFYAQVKPLLVALQRSTTNYSRPLVSIERLMDRFFGKQTSFSHSASFEKSNRHGRSSC